MSDQKKPNASAGEFAWSATLACIDEGHYAGVAASVEYVDGLEPGEAVVALQWAFGLLAELHAIALRQIHGSKDAASEYAANWAHQSAVDDAGLDAEAELGVVDGDLPEWLI